MAVFLYVVSFAAIFVSFFGAPFAVRRVPTALVFVVSSLALFYGAYLMAGFQNTGPYAQEGAPRLSFLMVLALSVVPLAAGSVTRLATLFLFKDEPNKLTGVAGIGAVATALFGGLGAVMFGLF